MEIDTASPSPSSALPQAENIGTVTPMDATASQIRALCDEIESVAGQLATAGDTRPDNGPETQEQLVRNAASIFVRLRLLNRKLHEDKAALTLSVNEMKQQTDDLALALENKRREISYLKKEIESTEKLETIYQHIEIIPLEEFQESAPEEYKQDTDSPHDVMLNRLRFEIDQRDMLMEERAQAKAKRDELRQAKRRRIDKLEKIDSQLQKYIKLMVPLTRSIGVIDDKSEEHGGNEEADKENEADQDHDDDIDGGSGETRDNGGSSSRSGRKHGGSKVFVEDTDSPSTENKRAREVRREGSSRVNTPRRT
ncbi:THO complex subunit 5 [Coemansia interrupta]|uniref:THO complex subunit 5 n=1 Tax=Coemansia interrupta TaxID=1126814 RepID=A0A9W8HJE7_9FUNG|nr:THO complex subunit 5 [Coemansia interrupta]